MIDLDKLYKEIGEFGLQQKIYFFSLTLFSLYSPFHMIQVIFTGQKPEFNCTVIDGTVFQNQCPDNQIEKCSEIIYSDEIDSFGREWDLICSESHKIKLIQSIFMIGVMSGALGFGPIADKWGRRISLFITLLGLIGSGVVSSIVTSYVEYAICRFLAGFFLSGNIICRWVLASELIGPTKRGFCGNIIQVTFAVGSMAYCTLAYFVKPWRELSFIATALGGVCLIPFWWLPESPRWLFLHGKSKEALKVLNHIAEKNGRRLSIRKIQDIPTPTQTSLLVGLKGIFTNAKVCWVTIIQLFSWFSNSVVYYGLTLAAGDLGSNIYITTGLSGLVEIPAYIAAIFLIESKLGRRFTLSGFMILGGISCVLVKYSTFIGFPLFGKLGIAASFSIIYIHSAELFPTVVRNSGLGLCSCFARIGGILSPFISLADDWSPQLQFILIGVLSISSGLLNLLLPETQNKSLPETIADL